MIFDINFEEQQHLKIETCALVQKLLKFDIKLVLGPNRILAIDTVSQNRLNTRLKSWT